MVTSKSKFVSLTFDDGPSPFTNQILDILGTYNIKATFFVVGEAAKNYPDIIKRMKAEKHIIGNHTWNHPPITDIARTELLTQLKKTNMIIKEIIGIEPTIFRPPYGSIDTQSLKVIHATGLKSVLWTVDSLDWSLKDEKVIIERIKNETKGDGIILLHDGDQYGSGSRNHTVLALPRIIENFIKLGYEFITIPDFHKKCFSIEIFNESSAQTEANLTPKKYVSPVNKKGKSDIAQSQPQIILMSNNKKYVVKFINNPQGNKMLMTEYVCTMLAQHLGLPTIPCEIVNVPKEFITQNKLYRYQFKPGNQFASLFLDKCSGLWFKLKKEQVRNRETLAGIVVFDFWLRNKDRDSSNILIQPITGTDYHIHLIDHGNCYPSRSALLEIINNPKKLKLSTVHNWCISMIDNSEEFTYYLNKINNLNNDLIKELVNSIPNDWGIPDEVKKQFYTNIIEAKQVLPEIVEMLKGFVKFKLD
jgi:peptidoglycan-N-acetylglucosamine deacetylase